MSVIHLFRPSKRALATAVAGCALLVSAIFAPRPCLIWNATASAPRGLYFLIDRRADRGDMVLVSTPPLVRQLAAERGYVPANVPLVKWIAAARADVVCGANDRVSINGIFVAVRRARDGRNRALPWWSGCRALGSNDIFLLMPDAPESFDGRYFGVTPRAAVIGRLAPLWTE